MHTHRKRNQFYNLSGNENSRAAPFNGRGIVIEYESRPSPVCWPFWTAWTRSATKMPGSLSLRPALLKQTYSTTSLVLKLLLLPFFPNQPPKPLCLTGKQSISGAKPLFRGLETVIFACPPNLFSYSLFPRVFERWLHPSFGTSALKHGAQFHTRRAFCVGAFVQVLVYMQVVSIVLHGSAFSLETLTYLSPLCFDINVLIVTGQVHLSHIFHIII